MAKRNFYIVSYDIAEQKRLKRVHKFLKDYGEWKQRSVFECWLTPEAYTQMKAGLKELINPRQDRVRIYRLCENCRNKAFVYGWGNLPDDFEEEIIV